MKKNILITGGAGYVGSELVPELLKDGHKVKIIDLFLYGNEVLKNSKTFKDFSFIKGDIRNEEILKRALKGIDTVIHLACISNDPSFELDPKLGKSINLDSFLPLIKISKKSGCTHFIYASSSSVYGIKKEKNVTENLSLKPLTDYSKYKAECEKILKKEQDINFNISILRPSTVCGFSRRQRLDVVVNILTAQAFYRKKIKIFGGLQLRPNIHIKDMVRAYIHILNSDIKKVSGKTYNVGFENYSLNQIAELVNNQLEENVKVEKIKTNDLRSYHVSSEFIKKDIGYIPNFSVEDAINDLIKSFKKELIPNALTDSKYYNVKKMQEIRLF